MVLIHGALGKDVRHCGTRVDHGALKSYKKGKEIIRAGRGEIANLTPTYFWCITHLLPYGQRPSDGEANPAGFADESLEDGGARQANAVQDTFDLGYPTARRARFEQHDEATGNEAIPNNEQAIKEATLRRKTVGVIAMG